MTLRIDSLEGFEGLRGGWDDLLQASSSDCFFLTWEWLHSWWKHLAGQRELSILTIHSDADLIGLAPFVIRSGRFSPPVVEFLGAGIVGSDYLDLIIRSGREAEVVDAIVDFVAERKWLLELGQIRTSALALRLAQALASRTGYRSYEMTTDVCPHIALGGHTWTSYLASLGSSHRANLQRRLKQLRRDFTFRFERAATEEQRAEFLAALIDLHRRRWSEKGASEAFSTSDIVSFHEDVSRLALERGWLRLFVMWLNDRPAAALYGFHRNRRFYFFQSGLDPEYSRYSVGLVTMGLAIQSAVEEGAEEFDLLHGNESYKSLWAHESREIQKLELYPPSASGILYGGIAQATRAARKLGWTVLPQSLADKIATSRRMAQAKGYYAAPPR
jgi:CelD/BcsL family acetyltransferase involved in cellulose biosynthesis